MAKLYAKAEEKLRDEEQMKLPLTNKVSCLGPEGSFSDCAAAQMCKGYEIVFCPNFSACVDLLERGEVDYAVLPVENSLNGGVLPVLDLLSSRDIFGEEELLLHIDHRIALLEGVKLGDVDTICSHEQAIGQCSQYLAEHFPDAAYIGARATSESLKKLNSHTAGIVGAHIRQEGVVLSEENIADNKQNFTRFLKVARGKGENKTKSAMVFLCAVCAHRPGSLLGLLKIFLRHGLNLTRIESRPVKEAFGEYRFFIEFAGDIASDRVRRALAEAELNCSQFKLLGAYM